MGDFGRAGVGVVAEGGPGGPPGFGDMPRGAFTPAARRAVEAAAGLAAAAGVDRVEVEHLAVALLDDPGGPLASAILEESGASTTAVRSRIAEVAGLRPGMPPGGPPAGDGVAFSEEARGILLASAILARDTGAESIAPEHLALAILDDPPARLDAALRLAPLRLPVAGVRARVARRVAVLGTRSGRVGSGSFPWLAPAVASDDLTASAAAGLIRPAVPAMPGPGRPDVFDRVARALHRRGGHALITGLKGVGKTTVLRELARRSEAGLIRFLRGKRFLWVDGRNVPPEGAADCLSAIFSRVEGEGDLVLCVDGLGSLLRKPGGGSHSRAFRSLVDRGEARVVGVLDRWEYADLTSGDPGAWESFARVDVEEPTDEVAEVIAIRAAEDLSGEYDLEIGKDVARRAVALAATYLLGERQPAKAVRVLRRACEEVDYERSQLGRDRRAVGEAEVIRAVSDLTGLPEETVSGGAGGEDLSAALGSVVVGQAEAIRIVADELALIKAGLAEPDKPASVMLFAGMTGVGKTELAKRVAELYSSSRRLQTYAMGNYLEPHTVSGIIGVPPGYVGHEAGGRIVNELNADPHAVFLLDEAEKCHPNIWKPFLGLFDEGWIVDARGVKAHADRAIFILTTNAGDDAIAQMSRSGQSAEEIEAYVKSTLSRVRQERSGQPVFPPQFLARIKRVVIFRPLDEAAMVDVARKVVERVRSLWLRRRDKRLDLPEGLVERVGRLAFRLNEAAGGKEGGRVVRKLVSDLIEAPVQREAARRLDEFRRARSIVVRPEPGPPGEPEGARPAITVGFSTDP